jgi:hypothetical protein
MWPTLAFSQLDTTLTYRLKEVHTIAYKNDSVTLSWKVDTIPYAVPFEIKFSPTKIAIDGYGTYKIVKHEIHGSTPIPQARGYDYYELSNGTTLTYIEKWIYWSWPIINKKTKMVIFIIDPVNWW